MPISTMIVLAVVVAVFAIFACALAWAQLQTRHLASVGVASRPKKRPL